MAGDKMSASKGIKKIERGIYKLISSQKESFEWFFAFDEMSLDNIKNFIHESNRRADAAVPHCLPSMHEAYAGTYKSAGLPKELGEWIKNPKGTHIENYVDFSSGEEKETFAQFLMKFCLFMVLSMKFSPERMVLSNTEEEFAECMKSLETNSPNKLHFRGQADSDWALIPSMIRNLDMPGSDGVYLDQESFYHLYDENGYSQSLIRKYNVCFPQRTIKSPKDIDYEFLSWMQHAASYSPLLDFTTDYAVAATFALRANNPNVFLYKDAAIFALDADERKSWHEDLEEIDEIISKMHISSIKRKIVPGTKMTIKNVLGRERILDFTSCDKIIDELAPSLVVIENPTNARMAKQRGVFLLFYDYTLVNGRMFNFTKMYTTIFKHVIRRGQDKTDLINWRNEKAKAAKLHDLMNPYADFED